MLTHTPVLPTATTTTTPTRVIPMTSTPTATDTASPTASPTATVEVGPDAWVNLGVVHFRIPGGLASYASIETTSREELPYINPSAGPFPEHWVITLEDYKFAVDGVSPQIIVFHVDSAEEMYGSAIDGLRKLTGADDRSGLGDVYVSRFYAQIIRVTSPWTDGVRFITQMIMDVCPINNEYVFYYYRGLSADGAYFISAQLPVDATFLTQSCGGSPLPAGGVPFPAEPGSAKFTAYLKDTAIRINSSKPDEWQPSLLLLDEMMRSVWLD
jgi:hypothetical protein